MGPSDFQNIQNTMASNALPSRKDDMPLKGKGPFLTDATHAMQEGKAQPRNMTLEEIPSQPKTEDLLIEFEQALISLSVIPNIGNPCMKRTMNAGPKKMIGNMPNSQIH